MATPVEICQQPDSDDGQNWESRQKMSNTGTEKIPCQKPEVSQCHSAELEDIKNNFVEKKDCSLSDGLSSSVDLDVDIAKNKSKEEKDPVVIKKGNVHKEVCKFKGNDEGNYHEEQNEFEKRRESFPNVTENEVKMAETENQIEGESSPLNNGKRKGPDDKEDMQDALASVKDSSSSSALVIASSIDDEEDRSTFDSPTSSVDMQLSSPKMTVFPCQGEAIECCSTQLDCRGKKEPIATSKGINTEPITEVLKEILQVTPERAAVKGLSHEANMKNLSAPGSPSPQNSGSMSEQSSASLHSIALDDPAIVTSSDVCATGTCNSTKATVPCEGNGNAYIMDLIKKSLQNDLVNKGDGDRVPEKTDREKAVEKVLDESTRTNSVSASDEISKTKNEDSKDKVGTEITTTERPVREMLVRRQASQTSMPASDKPVLETLTFGTSLDEGDGTSDGEEGIPKKAADCTCPCPLCDCSYPADNKEDVLAHLVIKHKFVIADVNFIGNLAVYLRYWKERLKTRPISEFCSKIVTNTGVKDEAEKEEFYLLCDALPEDKDIREQLQRKKLVSFCHCVTQQQGSYFCCLLGNQSFCLYMRFFLILGKAQVLLFLVAFSAISACACGYGITDQKKEKTTN
ncbi:Zinc finger protein 277 [Plakobranchus ocellatus]|uniref:Zinc finger protein 277 n=1 Tax=Plakobranchus ocellatus TaxID=259542 RepID=A0AAV4AG58_9GAST|nr:Zinc finger protein 277 [Plakobranchus ocellatus]